MSMEEFLGRIKFPVLCTPKIDGIRCLVINGKAVSRSLKPIPNHYIRKCIEEQCPDFIDGELTCGNNFQAVTSGIMSFEGKPNFTYYVFGCDIHSFKTYSEVDSNLQFIVWPNFCKPLFPTRCNNLEELANYETKVLAEGAEGVMIRPPDGTYKYGRATLNDQLLVAIKRFEDCEGTVVGFNELFSNANDPTRDALGYVDRATNASGLIPMDTLGSLELKLKDGSYVNVGTGFTAMQRRQIWLSKDRYMNKTVTIKFQRHGSKFVPRHPVFKNFRED